MIEKSTFDYNSKRMQVTAESLLNDNEMENAFVSWKVELQYTFPYVRDKNNGAIIIIDRVEQRTTASVGRWFLIVIK